MAFRSVVCTHFLLALFVSLFVSTLQNGLLVQTTSGPVEGVKISSVTGQDIRVFLGIPYAAPPVGELRFKPPIAVTPTKDVIKAKLRSKACLQVLRLKPSEDLGEMGKLLSPGREHTSEDCLYLNVWAPNIKGGEKLAVMVWIHGGGYELGTANSMFYDGQVLASEAVIVVSMNYRLSVFGFLAFDPEEIPGNVGLMDQALALKWVQDNIERFGGDPSRVTIFGESAGGGSVSHQILLPSSQGLFQRAILQSGTATAPWSYSSKKHAVKTAELLIEAVGCQSSSHSATIKCLREADPDDLIKEALLVNPDTLIGFNPSVDGVYIREDVILQENQLKFKNDVDILLGATNDDGTLFVIIDKIFPMSEDSFLSEDDFTNHLKRIIRSENPALINFAKFLYTNWENESTNWVRPMIDLMTDVTFACPTVQTADNAAANGNKVYYYEFEHRPSINKLPSWVRATHADDLGPVFGMPLLIPGIFSTEDAEFSKKIIKYWTQFAKTGNPNPAGDNEVWPQYTLPQKEALSLQINEHIITGVRVQRCAFINKLIPQLTQALHKNDLEQHCDKFSRGGTCNGD